MPVYKTQELFNLDKTIAKPFLAKKQYPWQALPGIAGFIRQLGETLPTSLFTKTGEDIWIANSASIAPSAFIAGPCIICEGAELRHSAFIRGSVIVGRHAVVGNSTELKNTILFDEVQVPHFNYVGDSILGHRAHFGAGVIASNIKSDKSPIVIHSDEGSAETGLIKIGVMAGDGAEVGCNSVLNPGTILGQNCTVYPLSLVRGTVPRNCLFKTGGVIVPKL